MYLHKYTLRARAGHQSRLRCFNPRFRPQYNQYTLKLNWKIELELGLALFYAIIFQFEITCT